MKKQIKDLKAGERFLDSLNEKLRVEKLVESRVAKFVTVYFFTEAGHHMFMRFRQDRYVEVVK